MYLGYSVKSKTLVQEIMRVMILITEIMPEKMIEETMIEENSEIQEILERIEELIIEEKMIGELIIEERMIGEMIIGETTIEETIIEETIIEERMIGEMIIEETIIGEMMIGEMMIEEMIIEETTIEETTIEETTIEETTIEEMTIEEMIIEETTIATAIIVAIQVAPVLWTEELRIRSAKTITMTPPMTTDITQTAIITMTSEANWSTAKIRANSALTAATAASRAMRVVIRTASITPAPRIIVRTTKRNVLASCVCALFVEQTPHSSFVFLRFIQIEFSMYMQAWLSSIHVKNAICCDGFRMFIYRSTISFIVFMLSSIFYLSRQPTRTFVCSSFSSESVSCRFFRCVRIRAFAPKIDCCCSGVNYVPDPSRCDLHFAANQRPDSLVPESRLRNLVVFAEILEIRQIVVDGVHRCGSVFLAVPTHQERFDQLESTSPSSSYIGRQQERL